MGNQVCCIVYEFQDFGGRGLRESVLAEKQTLSHFLFDFFFRSEKQVSILGKLFFLQTFVEIQPPALIFLLTQAPKSRLPWEKTSTYTSN